MSAFLAWTNSFQLPWYQILFFAVTTTCLVAIAFVHVTEYMRTHSIERAFRLKNLSPSSIGDDTATNKYVVGLAGFLENRSIHPLFMKIERGSITLQGRSPERMELPKGVLEVQAGDAARIGFPLISQLDIGQPITGRFTVGVRFGRSKDGLTHFYYTEGDVLITIIRDGAQAIVQLNDSITEAVYGRAAENW